ncbi:MAG: hypothetical protein ACRDY3_08070 [Acidimicrobiales bacterium]
MNGAVLDTIAATKMTRHQWLAIFTVGDLHRSGLELWDTGESPHHDVVHENKAQLVVHMRGCSHRLIVNTHYNTPEGDA